MIKDKSISLKQVETGKIEKIQELKEISPDKFNRWRMISQAKKGCYPGNIYKDPEKLFHYHGWIVPNAFTDKKNYDKIVTELQANEEIQYILIDLSSECDIAQNKLFLSRLVPGVMIPSADLAEYCTASKIKKSIPSYIFLLSDVEIDGKSWSIAFNVNQMFATEKSNLLDANLRFSLTGSYVTNLKQTAASCVSKQGIEVFGSLR